MSADHVYGSAYITDHQTIPKTQAYLSGRKGIDSLVIRAEKRSKVVDG